MADRYGTDSLAGGYRKARPVQELDAAAGDYGIFPEPARYLPGAFRHHCVGSRIRNRPDAWFFHSRVPRRRDCRGVGAVCVARPVAGFGCRVRPVVA